MAMAGRIARGLIAALAFAVACVFPNPAQTIAMAASTAVTEPSSGPAAIEHCEDVDPGVGTDAESQDGDEDDDDGNNGPSPELSDDVVEHEPLFLGLASGDRLRLYASGEARPAFSSRLPRPSGLV